MNGNSTLAQAASPARQTEVQGAHDILHTNCEELSMVVADLETRLHPVLAQRAETGGKDGLTQPEPLRVLVAQMFHDRSSQGEPEYYRSAVNSGSPRSLKEHLP